MNSVPDSSPGFGDELVVGLDLVGDGLVGEHALGPRHLLHLEAHGVGVLEHDGDDVTERDPATASSCR